jgi:hypothetical protein
MRSDAAKGVIKYKTNLTSFRSAEAKQLEVLPEYLDRTPAVKTETLNGKGGGNRAYFY